MCNSQPGTAARAAESGSCACGGQGDAATRRVDAVQELELPAFAFPSPALLESVGEARLRQVVRRHHERLRFGPLAGLFPPEEAAFAELVARVADYVVESCGGAADYSSVHGSTCMRTRHFPFSIDESAREVWLEALFQAMVDIDFPNEAREEYWNWLEPFSVRMINRRTMKAQPARIPYVLARLRFAPQAPDPSDCGIGIRFCPH